MSNASIEESPEGHDQDLKRKVLIGTVWTVATRWGVRLLGLLSTVVLARLLDPEDFGLVAMASVFTGIVMAFTELEMDIPLITERNLDDSYFDTAWTLSVIAGLLAGMAIMLVAPLAATY